MRGEGGVVDDVVEFVGVVEEVVGFAEFLIGGAALGVFEAAVGDGEEAFAFGEDVGVAVVGEALLEVAAVEVLGEWGAGGGEAGGEEVGQADESVGVFWLGGVGELGEEGDVEDVFVGGAVFAPEAVVSEHFAVVGGEEDEDVLAEGGAGGGDDAADPVVNQSEIGEVGVLEFLPEGVVVVFAGSVEGPDSAFDAGEG